MSLRVKQLAFCQCAYFSSLAFKSLKFTAHLRGYWFKEKEKSMTFKKRGKSISDHNIVKTLENCYIHISLSVADEKICNQDLGH